MNGRGNVGTRGEATQRVDVYRPAHFTFHISHDARKVFDAAMHGLVGVGYKPLAVATQVVAGTNYCFLCEATPVYPGATPYAAKVYIFQPLQGQHPHITQIIHDKP